MDIKDARTINAGALYERRKQAVPLFKKDMKRHEIAPIVGVHRLTVGNWIRSWQERGLSALKANESGRPKGTGRKLHPDEEADAKQVLVEQASGSGLVPGAVPCENEPCRRWRLLETLGIHAALENAEIHWGDETGIRSDDVNARGYAPKGRTPIQKVKGTPEKLNMTSSVSNQGKLHFMVYKEAMNASLLIKFLKRLARCVGRKVILILDNLKVHHSKVLKAWLEANKSLIEIHHLPSYSQISILTS